jgi:hypothetical protein
MVRMIALLSVLFIGFAAPAFAGDKQDPCSYPGYKDGACQPGHGGQDDGDVPNKPGHGHPGHKPGHPGHGHPGHGFPGHGGHYNGLCAGGFQGFYGNGFPVAFLIQQVGYNQLQVQAWYGGGMFYGTGLCAQINGYQASFELYFPGAPIHRGVISTNGYASVMEGQLDFHYPFQLQRTR